jgi:hypothetical protein
MTDSPSGELNGPIHDYENLHSFLTSNLGGNWYDYEIIPLENPTKWQLKQKISEMAGCDYAFIVFTGHGALEERKKLQYIELMDGDVSIRELLVACKRQTIVIDACRGFFSRLLLESLNSLGGKSHYEDTSTRRLFDNALVKAEEGLTVLYAASENQSALDTNLGAAYISSLIGVAEEWNDTSEENILSIKKAHENAIYYMHNNFVTKQEPMMNKEKRLRHYPFAVKHS